jgi:hypothetical protein
VKNVGFGESAVIVQFANVGSNEMGGIAVPAALGRSSRAKRLAQVTAPCQQLQHMSERLLGLNESNCGNLKILPCRPSEAAKSRGSGKTRVQRGLTYVSERQKIFPSFPDLHGLRKSCIDSFPYK